MGYNDDLPVAALNSVGNAIFYFLASMIPSKFSYYTPVIYFKVLRETNDLAYFTTV
jgi:hypothetical protein